ncbi:unnamed protein product, partial [Effrenium voratum]
PGGRLSFVTMAPNVEEMPQRMKRWLDTACEGLVFRGTATPAPRYQPTSSSVETTRYQAALQRLGVTSLSEVVGVLQLGGAAAQVSLAGAARPELWADHSFLRMVVQQSASPLADSAMPSSAKPPREAPEPVQPEPVQPEPVQPEPVQPKPVMPVTQDPATDPYAAAANAAAAVSAATAPEG